MFGKSLINLFFLKFFCLLSLFLTAAQAEEKIIKNESMSFELCLKVISVSEDKLSIAPKISDSDDKKRVATFSLVDGMLTITCDGQKGLVLVTTKTD